MHIGVNGNRDKWESSPFGPHTIFFDYAEIFYIKITIYILFNCKLLLFRYKYGEIFENYYANVYNTICTCDDLFIDHIDYIDLAIVIMCKFGYIYSM